MGRARASSDAEAARAQGQTVAHRAAALLRAVGPDAAGDLVRSVVDGAAGSAEPELARTDDVPARDVLLVAAVLLAQSVRDEGGADELAEELAELLPDERRTGPRGTGGAGRALARPAERLDRPGSARACSRG